MHLHRCRRALFAATLLLPTLLSAQTWTESATGAGQTWSTSETPLGSGPLTRIQGTIAAGRSADIYLVRIDDPATFRVSSIGGANFDTQLWMFGVDGRGIAFRDDDPGSTQSTLSGQFSGAGSVLIAVSQYDNDALDQNGNQLWNDSPFATERAPDGPGALNSFTQWSGTSTAARPYTLTLRGASFAAEANPVEGHYAFAWVRNPPTSTIPSINYQRTPSGELITATRLSTGFVELLLPAHLDEFGNVQVCAAPFSGNLNFYSVVDGYARASNGKVLMWVMTRNAAGQPTDGDFSMVYRVGGSPTARTAYVWADRASSASWTLPTWTPEPQFSFNGNRGAITIRRISVGRYDVTLPGLATVGATRGHVQVSGYRNDTRAQVSTWFSQGSTGSDMVVEVRTFAANGTPSDREFLLSYTETAAAQPPHLGSGAFLFANNSLSPSYTPDPLLSDSNGANGPAAPITITRLGLGRYDVLLPAHIDVLGVPIVGLLGTTPGVARVRDWVAAPGGATKVSVECTDINGNLSNSVFLLQFTSAIPAGTPARNDVVGGSCNGSTLRGISRPRLGGTWELALDSLPPAATLGFTILGFTNPNLPLDGLGLPGCVLHADLTLIGVFLGNPALSLNVPNSPSLLGGLLHAQGGAFEPTLNAFGAGLGNGIRGVIGNV